MMSSTSPMQDLSPPQNSPQHKKRARGRPLKPIGQSTVPEERRQQVRNAQNAFRQRKQAAIKSLEQRAVVLEDCVEEISKVFLDFSDFMLRAQLVQKDPAMGRNLLSTTERIVELARIACEANGTSSSEEEKDSSNSRIGRTLTDSTYPKLSNDEPRIHNVFGNGWFGYEPKALAHTKKANPNLDIPPGGFGIKLIQTNLQVAYYGLTDPTGVSNTLISQMHRYALLYHTRDEILANLRWFLEHGLPAQRYLGRAVFGFDTTLSLEHLKGGNVYPGFKRQILHPLVDAQALLDTEYVGVAMPFLNAFDIEEYLVRKGAFHIDDEVIFMQILSTNVAEHGHEEGASRNEISMSGHLEVSRTPQYTTPNSSEILASPPNDRGNEAIEAHGKPCEIFDFNALLKDVDDRPIMEDILVGRKKKQPSREQTQIISIDVPLLVDNLIRHSICLGTGPAYPQSMIDIAIESSTRPSITSF